MLSLCHVAFTLDAADYRNPSATADGGAVLFRAWDACLSSSEANAAAVLFNYANALTRWERPGAADSYERVITLEPSHSAAHFNLASVQYHSGDLERARDSFAAALALRPNDADAATMLGAVESDLGNDRRALDAYNVALRNNPNDSTAKRLKSALEGSRTDESFSYAQELFDEYHPRYDSEMIALQAASATLIFDELHAALEARSSWLNPPFQFRNVVDLGAGTGAAMLPFVNAPLCAFEGRSVVGVDASSNMLGGARERRCANGIPLYTGLVVDDMARALIAMAEASVDLVISSDSFVYSENLTPIFVGASRVLRAGGYLAFTVEEASAEEDAIIKKGGGVEEDGGCILQRSGRYKHTARYIKDELRKQSGFEMIRKRQAIGRVERGVPVQVLVVIVQKI